jgi:hypothetical protein
MAQPLTKSTGREEYGRSVERRPWDIPAGSGTQKIPVTVGGHPLNPAIKGRKVTWTADGTVTIEWPDD